MSSTRWSWNALGVGPDSHTLSLRITMARYWKAGRKAEARAVRLALQELVAPSRRRSRLSRSTPLCLTGPGAAGSARALPKVLAKSARCPLSLPRLASDAAI